ncbi:hypothetical protein JSQ81_06480 [Sporosarcina sp. Marseille-Q4063]|uniref:baeRF3 domain-containing protein n=1 Tax=Sporosarcina sp. Marseille-Q4063 TaxID=2810514 RepID=UPI001BAE90AD|nr:hypothetical protein [Sporosarcina sp. Marseille-Q4063]QUW23203.1 hypothetical protein JSQ81_06480 [Sporosarcina sp. Marseille-Q4063]
MYEIVNDFPNELFNTDLKPCISLYQPTFRHGPETQQNTIRFSNLVKEIEESLNQKYSKKEVESLLKPFETLLMDKPFWEHAGDGVAVFANSEKCIVYRLQRSVKEFAVVADSFHIKLLIRVFQSDDRYHLLGLNRKEFALFEGSRYGFEEVELDPELPLTIEDALGDELTESYLSAGAVSGSGGQAMFHGHGSKKDEIDKDIERFFRSVDRTVLEHYSKPMNLPLFLVALDEYHTPFQRVSHNPMLEKEGIKVAYDALSIKQLVDGAWKKIEPQLLAKTKKLVDEFENARANDKGSDDIAQIVRAATENRISKILIEADRIIPGGMDMETGDLIDGKIGNPEVDDVLDDLAEMVFNNSGEVVVLPKERMPSTTGAAAVYRY